MKPEDWAVAIVLAARLGLKVHWVGWNLEEGLRYVESEQTQ